MTDPRLSLVLCQLGYSAIVLPYESEDDPGIKAFVWLLNVPADQLCRAEDETVDLAFAVFGSDPLPFMLGVATPAKTAQVLAPLSAKATNQAASGLKIRGFEQSRRPINGAVANFANRNSVQPFRSSPNQISTSRPSKSGNPARVQRTLVPA